VRSPGPAERDNPFFDNADRFDGRRPGAQEVGSAYGRSRNLLSERTDGLPWEAVRASCERSGSGALCPALVLHFNLIFSIRRAGNRREPGADRRAYASAAYCTKAPGAGQ
jgi:hypothetical protein